MEDIRIKKLKSMAKGQLLGKYSALVSATLSVNLFIVALSLVFSSITPEGNAGKVISVVFQAVISIVETVLILGYTGVILKAVCNMNFVSSMVMDGFKENRWKPAVLCEIRMILYFVLLMIPGSVCMILYMIGKDRMYIIPTIVLYSLAAIIYIYLQIVYSFRLICILDFPGRKPGEYMKLSKDILKGHFFKMLGIELAFIPWKIVSLVTLGLAGLWIKPYRVATKTNYYLYLMSKR